MFGDMPLNNNQKADSAAARMAKLPVVRSAWTKLSVVYTGTKGCHPNLKIICEALENSVAVLSTMATDKISPVIVILEPQISVANDIACKSLDWLESTFPVLQTPTEEIVAIAKDKMHEAQEVVTVAAFGTMGCVQHSVEHVMSRVLPPAEEDKDEDPSVEEFESTTLRTYPIRLVSVTTKMCRRTYKQAIKTMSRSSGLAQDLQTQWSTFLWSLKDLPQYLQYQAVTVITFISQMYTLSCPSPKQIHSSSATEASHKDRVKVHLQDSPTWRLRTPMATDHRCKSCEAYHDRDSNAKSCASR